MNLRINKAHWPVTVLGFGRRIALWVQGCSIACPGCCSTDTWSASDGASISTDEIVLWCQAATADGLDGITVSGGEPFEQAEALAELVRKLSDWRSTLGRDVDILCYSGLPEGKLRRRFPDLLSKFDAVISEPYLRSLPPAPLRGSSNQKILAVTELGRRRYCRADGEDFAKAPTLQVQVADGRVWMVGIPNPGDLPRLTELCAARGLMLDETSWKA